MRTLPTLGLSPIPMHCVAITNRRSSARLNERAVMLGAARRSVKPAEFLAATGDSGSRNVQRGLVRHDPHGILAECAASA
jgi:hypothetical protein